MSVAHGTSEGSTPTIPGYALQALLGVGGMGKVYLARQETLKRLVCVKVLSIPEGEDPILCRARFNREAELLASVAHPHIVSIFDYGTTADQGLPFLVTEYIEGGDLRTRMTRGKPMSVGKAREILLQVGEALHYLHGKGIIHRDLKPENILLPTDSLYKVCDFGLAVMRDKTGTLTRFGHGLGTLGYVSPEQHYGLKVDERADQYSLAAIAYELLTGRRPLGRFHPPSRWNHQLSPELDRVILKGLAEQPTERYPSVSDFVNAVVHHLSSSRRGRPGLRPAAIGLLIGLGAITAAVALMALGAGRKALPGRLEKPPLVGTAPAAGPEPQKPAENSSHDPTAGKDRRSAEFTRLTQLRAYRIWVGQGSPRGKAGEDVKEANWLEAEKQIEAEVNARADALGEQEGRPRGSEGEAAREKNRRAAELQLLQETEDEKNRHPVR